MAKKLRDIQVLIVEDEPSLNAAYTAILETQKIKTETCFNGEEALAKIASQNPDVILLDLRMPKMNGIEFLKQLTNLGQAGDAKIIIFSNYDEQNEIDEAFSLGATRYMLKSWTSPKELVKLVREAV